MKRAVRMHFSPTSHNGIQDEHIILIFIKYKIKLKNAINPTALQYFQVELLNHVVS